MEAASTFSNSHWCQWSAYFSSANYNLDFRDAANFLSFSLLIRFNLCTCQGSPATVTFMHRVVIGLLEEPLLFSAKKARGTEERGKVMTKEGGKRIKRNCSDSSNIPAYCKLRRPSWINILYLSWVHTSKIQTGMFCSLENTSLL